jgi:hypothetical protein
VTEPIVSASLHKISSLGARRAIRRFKFPNIFKALCLVRILLSPERQEIRTSDQSRMRDCGVVKLKASFAIELPRVVSHFAECENLHMLRRGQKVVSGS